MKLGEIILKLRYRLNDMTTDVEGEYRDEELIKYINEALSWFCRVLREYKMTVRPTDTTPLTITGNNDGDGSVCDCVQLPEDMFDVERVIEQHSSNGSTMKKLLIRKTRYDLEDLYPIEGYRQTPKYYAVENNYIYIYPTKETVTYTLDVRGYAIQKLVNDYDSIDWFRENYQAPFLDACEYMARRTRPTVDENMQIAQGLANNVLAFFNERGRVEPRQAGVK